jgi:hypothetical protein
MEKLQEAPKLTSELKGLAPFLSAWNPSRHFVVYSGTLGMFHFLVLLLRKEYRQRK